MDAYTSFAQVYDLFMDNVPYEEWCAYLCRVLDDAGIADGLVVELGCGTGKMTRLMEARGYDMVGVDNSVDMLGIAAQENTDASILYLLQDMRELELYGTVRAFYSVCDSMNYILSPRELLSVFRLVYDYLEPGGIFVFDMNTPYKYRTLLAENTFAENRKESSFIWENFYDEVERINEYALTLFIREESGLYRKFEETHCQCCYEPDEVAALLQQAGFVQTQVYDGYTMQPLEQASERMTFIGRRLQ